LPHVPHAAPLLFFLMWSKIVKHFIMLFNILHNHVSSSLMSPNIFLRHTSGTLSMYYLPLRKRDYVSHQYKTR
jgi:hypothetical protein